ATLQSLIDAWSSIRLEELADVSFQSASTNDIMQLNASGVWTNKSLNVALSTSFLETINNLSDLDDEATARTNLNVYSTDEVDTTIAGLASVYQPLDSDLTALAALSTEAYGLSILETASATAARILLDVDQAGTDNSTDVTLAGSYDYLSLAGQVVTLNQIDLTTDVTGDLPIAEGGTGASDEATARTNLGVAIGSDVQAYSALLSDISSISFAQGDILYYNGSALVNLAPGTNGYVLSTQGAGANPQWVAAGAGDLQAANNLSDVDTASTDFDNIKQDATTTTTGVVELATDAEALAGSDTTRAVTAAGLASAQSQASDGYITLPGGVIIQWGEGDDGANSFPVTFPTACTAVVSTPNLGNRIHSITSISTSSFTIDSRVASSGSASGVDGRYMAIGY
ncbi:MAG: hypothetical protein KDA17_07185, partial [Candidatus Saccharibacteria bacterium]|nr:hypothetical protein [Candidatus Saccharibacteria bacterium]